VTRLDDCLPFGHLLQIYNLDDTISSFVNKSQEERRRGFINPAMENKSSAETARVNTPLKQ